MHGTCKIKKTFSVELYGFETRHLTLSAEHWLCVLQNKVLE